MNSLIQGRRFQFWEYRVGHGSLLIRSPISTTADTNVDLKFFGVSFVSVPRHLGELTIEEASPSDSERFKRRFGVGDREGNVYVLNVGAHKYHIVATQLIVDSNQTDIFDSPFG